MIKRLLIRIFGLALTGAAIAGILFSGLLAELGGGRTPTLHYLASAGLFIGIFGPLLIWGLHCLLFRWRCRKRHDWKFIALMASCVVTSVVIALSLTRDPHVLAAILGPGFVSFLISAMAVELTRRPAPD